MRNLLLLTHQFVYSRLAVRCKVYLPIAMLAIMMNSSTALAQNCACGRASIFRLSGTYFWNLLFQNTGNTGGGVDTNGCLPCPTTTTTTVTTTSSTTSTTVTTTTAPTVTLPRQPIQLPYGRCSCTCVPTTCSGIPGGITTISVTTTTLIVSKVVVCPATIGHIRVWGTFIAIDGTDLWDYQLRQQQQALEQTYNSRYGVGNWVYGTRPNCIS